METTSQNPELRFSMEPDNSRIVRLHNRTIKALSGYTTGQVKHCPVAQPDNSSAARLRIRTTPALPGCATGPGYSTGQLQRYPVTQAVPLRNRMALSAGLRIGQFDLPSCATVPLKRYQVTQPDNPWTQPDNSRIVRLHNRSTKSLSGYTTGQLKLCPVTQPDN